MNQAESPAAQNEGKGQPVRHLELPGVDDRGHDHGRAKKQERPIRQSEQGHETSPPRNRRKERRPVPPPDTATAVTKSARSASREAVRSAARQPLGSRRQLTRRS